LIRRSALTVSGGGGEKKPFSVEIFRFPVLRGGDTPWGCRGNPVPAGKWGLGEDKNGKKKKKGRREGGPGAEKLFVG